MSHPATNAPRGTLWEGSMFDSTGRDESVYGPPDVLDFYGPPGPFDDEHGPEGWRLVGGGRRVFTGEALVRSARLDGGRGVIQGGFSSRGGEEMRFPDVLPVRSGQAGAFANAPTNNGAVRGPVVAASGDLAETPAGEQRGVGHVENLHATLPSLAHHHPETLVASSDVDADYVPALPQPPTTTISNHNHDHDHDHLPDSIPPKTSSPHGIDDWDDDNLLSLWKWKAIRKKGYQPMLAHFPGQTVEVLAQAWVRHKKRCEVLGKAWRAKGKPEGSVGEWFDVNSLLKSGGMCCTVFVHVPPVSRDDRPNHHLAHQNMKLLSHIQ
ncbi:hypothetical protein EJ07DRAFT_154786 [Lizonia empirigonia]|nr:hypothetical protein EJ07DRAFT_154786 [Lizonia empirigonia]